MSLSNRNWYWYVRTSDIASSGLFVFLALWLRLVDSINGQKNMSVVAWSNWAFVENACFTVCRDISSVLTNCLTLTPRKFTVRAFVQLTAPWCSLLSLALRADESSSKTAVSSGSSVVNSRCLLPCAVIKASANFLLGYTKANALLI